MIALISVISTVVILSVMARAVCCVTTHHIALQNCISTAHVKPTLIQLFAPCNVVVNVSSCTGVPSVKGLACVASI